jgi:hypothetical protein
MVYLQYPAEKKLNDRGRDELRLMTAVFMSSLRNPLYKAPRESNTLILYTGVVRIVARILVLKEDDFDSCE